MKKKKKQVTNTFLRLKLSTMKPLNGLTISAATT